MSREFGDGPGGFFHEKIQNAADDARGGRFEITKATGALLQALYPLAYAISSAEACDSGEERPLMVALDEAPALHAALSAVIACADTHRRMMVERSARDVAPLLSFKVTRDPLSMSVDVPRQSESRDRAHWRDVLDECARTEWHRAGLPGWPSVSSTSWSGGSSVERWTFVDGRTQAWSSARAMLKMLDEGRMDDLRATLKAIARET